MWRVIPSCIDTAKGTVLAYTVEEAGPGLCRYAYREVPLDVAFREDGSYSDTRATAYLEGGHPW